MNLGFRAAWQFLCLKANAVESDAVCIGGVCQVPGRE